MTTVEAAVPELEAQGYAARIRNNVRSGNLGSAPVRAAAT